MSERCSAILDQYFNPVIRFRETSMCASLSNWNLLQHWISVADRGPSQPVGSVCWLCRFSIAYRDLCFYFMILISWQASYRFAALKLGLRLANARLEKEFHLGFDLSWSQYLNFLLWNCCQSPYWIWGWEAEHCVHALLQSFDFSFYRRRVMGLQQLYLRFLVFVSLTF